MKIHIKSWSKPGRFRCGRKHVTIPPHADELCKACEASSKAEDRRNEAEAERQIDAGVLEADEGPNRRWNEY